MINTDELRKAAMAVSLATNEAVAQDLSDKLNKAAEEINELRDFAIWMTGCGYDFCQHAYFCEKRDKLLKNVYSTDELDVRTAALAAFKTLCATLERP